MTGFGGRGEEASGNTVAVSLSARFGAHISHRDVRELRGPLLVLGGADGISWDEFATIDLDGGGRRHGLVLEVDKELTTLQVLESTDGMARGGIGIRFDGRPLHVQVGAAWLGRVCNGRGEPLDGGPPVTGTAALPVSGWPLNPVYREPPAEPVLTGVSVIDGLLTLVRGQKLPIFSVPGLPHLTLATQIASQATSSGQSFRVVFAAMGLTHADIAYVRDRLEERSAGEELILLLNAADDPVIERILTPPGLH